jgi:protein ImuA
MLVSAALSPSPAQDATQGPAQTAALAELRRLLSRHSSYFQTSQETALAFGVAALDCHLPNGGLAESALHEVVPATQAAFPAAFGFIVAALARFISPRTSPHYPYPPPSSLHSGARERGPGGGKILFVMSRYQSRQCGRLSGHGLNRLGFDPRRAILVETAHRHDTLWALMEALRSGAPQAVVGMIDRLDLKTSQKLHLAAVDSGLPLLLLRPSQTLESSAAATRWRIGAAAGARDRFGCYTRPRWRLQLERCRNGRPGEWVVEYDHVAHRFSLVAALADQTFSRRAGDRPRRQAGRS